MTVLKDYMDLAKNAVKFYGDVSNTDGYKSIKGNRRSVSEKAKEGILQFPVIATDTIEIETLQSVTKALETNYSAFVKIVYAMNPVAKMSDTEGIGDYLKKFHQNMNVKNTINDIYLSVKESTESGQIESDTEFIIESQLFDGATGKVLAINKDSLYNVMESFREESLNNKYVPSLYDVYAKIPVTEASNKKNKSKVNSKSGSSFDKWGNPYSNNSSSSTNRKASNPEMSQGEYNAARNKREQEIHDDRMSKLKNKSGMTQDEFNEARNKREEDLHNSRMNTPKEEILSTPELSSSILKDKDVKKANEMVPTTMVLRINFQQGSGKDKNIIGSQDFIVGIKCVLHPVSSKEMVANLSNISKGKFFDFIRWTSGEISFVKDFLLNMDEIKTDIANRSAGSNPLWIALKRRAELSKIKSNSIAKGSLLPNASIIMSKEEVNYLRDNYGIDYNDESNAERLMKKFFLLGLVIVDDSQQIVQFMFDGDTQYQTLSFSGLDYEGKSNSSDFKDLLKLVNRM